MKKCFLSTHHSSWAHECCFSLAKFKACQVVLQNIENESKIAHFQANKRQRQGTTSPKTWQTFQAPILYAWFYSTLNEDASSPLQSSSSVERTTTKHFSVQGGDGGQVLKPNFMDSKKIE